MQSLVGTVVEGFVALRVQGVQEIQLGVIAIINATVLAVRVWLQVVVMVVGTIAVAMVMFVTNVGIYVIGLLVTQGLVSQVVFIK